MIRSKLSIIGANSFLGRNVIEEVNNNDWELTLYAREKPLLQKEFEFILFDYPNYSLDIDRLLSSDIIIYAAGAGIQSGLKESVDLVYQLNAFIPISLLNLLNEKNYKGKIITFGSYFEIGEVPTKYAYNEEELVSINSPVPNHYCSSKRLLTRFVISGLLDIKYYHLILPTIYGPGENGNRLIPYVINCLKNNKKLVLTSGEQERSYLYVKDLVCLLLQLCESEMLSGTYNVCSNTQIRIKDLVKEVARIYNVQLKNITLGTVRNDIKMQFLELNCLKLSNSTSWCPSHTLKDVIPKY
ncbi:NAD-dependent epimerase/dehydratase family protein [Rufibacter tibetensis]|uniref:NAD-dependent epimerase/dehydratase domain-containing protein n=1 Tax=Rufibacter tibetensis TaxID=512763 RepID=A0A0P0CYI8_9BACT|nr:NAD(P)-dependent oxidoreductase [Rufibacter tibetensis]ALI99757.1 hypothetical protein DC20_13210 [Rufibacter tibetensis]